MTHNNTTYSHGRCQFCDESPPEYPVEFHSDYIHTSEGYRDFDSPFPFTEHEKQVRLYVEQIVNTMKRRYCGTRDRI